MRKFLRQKKLRRENLRRSFFLAGTRSLGVPVDDDDFAVFGDFFAGSVLHGVGFAERLNLSGIVRAETHQIIFNRLRAFVGEREIVFFGSEIVGIADDVNVPAFHGVERGVEFRAFAFFDVEFVESEINDRELGVFGNRAVANPCGNAIAGRRFVANVIGGQRLVVVGNFPETFVAS